MPASYTCDLVRSRKRRDPLDESLLVEQAAHIHVLSLEGAIFFGTAERLFESIEATVVSGGRCVILDLRHVTDIDNTGARLMLAMHEKLRKQKIPLLLSHLQPLSNRSQMLTDVGLLAALGPEKLCHDTDRHWNGLKIF